MKQNTVVIEVLITITFSFCSLLLIAVLFWRKKSLVEAWLTDLSGIEETLRKV